MIFAQCLKLSLLLYVMGMCNHWSLILLLQVFGVTMNHVHIRQSTYQCCVLPAPPTCHAPLSLLLLRPPYSLRHHTESSIRLITTLTVNNHRLPQWVSCKESAWNAGAPGDVGSIPGSGGSPWVANSNPLQFSCLWNPMEREAQRAIVHGVTKVGHDLATRTWLSDWNKNKRDAISWFREGSL